MNEKSGVLVSSLNLRQALSKDLSVQGRTVSGNEETWTGTYGANIHTPGLDLAPMPQTLDVSQTPQSCLKHSSRSSLPKSHPPVFPISDSDHPYHQVTKAQTGKLSLMPPSPLQQ